MIPYSTEGCRHFLESVSEMHKMGFQRVRIQPHVTDSAGGGRWRCGLAPAGLKLNLFNKSYPCFPFGLIGKELAYPAQPKVTASAILELFPQLALSGRGVDEVYARWFEEMLLLTKPYGLVFESHYSDGQARLPTDAWRVLGDEEDGEIGVPPPPLQSF